MEKKELEKIKKQRASLFLHFSFLSKKEKLLLLLLLPFRAQPFSAQKALRSRQPTVLGVLTDSTRAWWRRGRQGFGKRTG